MGKVTPHQAEAVRQLLDDEGKSIRVISKLTGVSRGTVSRIAAGKWRPHVPKKPEVRDTPDAKRPVGLCPVCEVKVYMPCRACAVREFMRKKRRF